MLTLSTGEILIATDVAVQPDGKTVVVGSANRQFATARFNVDGTLDLGFADAGIARNQLSNQFNSFATAVTVAPDGKIVVVGEADVDSGHPETEMAAVRYNADGSLDNTFSENGKLTVDLSEFPKPTRARDVAIAPDGRIIVVGETYSASLLGDDSFDFFVAFFDPDGELRGRNDGVERVGFGEQDGARAVKIDSGGRIVVVGDVSSSSVTPTSQRVGLTRLSPVSGGGLARDIETIFALPGQTHTLVQDLILQSGKIVIAGQTPSADGSQDFFIARFSETGALDTTFAGGTGYAILDLGDDDVVGGITATPAGGGGFIVSGRSGGETMIAVKYTDNGTLDAGFGTGGIQRISGLRDLDQDPGGVRRRAAPAIAPGPGRRVALAGGNAFATARMFLAGANVVSSVQVDSSAGEGTTNTGSLFVGRSERLPFPTRVFLSVGGTATGLVTSRTDPRDYTMPGLITPTFGTPYVDIPAGETFVVLTLTTFNDSRVEGTEAAVFTIVPNTSYDVGSPNSGRINITDDDTTSLSIGTTTVAPPPKHVEAGQELAAVLTWTVPSGGWRQLSTIQLRVRDLDDEQALAVLTFDEASNSFALDATTAGAGAVSLVPERCTFAAAGPTSPTVTVTFTFLVEPGAAGRRFALDASAENDPGGRSGFTQVAKLYVRKSRGQRHDLLLPPWEESEGE